MSGLEPIAALGLAGNILQIIGVGRETVRIAMQVYQDGALDPALTDKARVLGDLSARILSTTTIKTTATKESLCATTSKLTSQDKQLLDLAKRCAGAARDLREEVNFLSGPSSRANITEALKSAAMAVWRKPRLKNLDRMLRDAEGLLQTGLLTRIYERSERTNSGISELDANLRSFLDEYRKGEADATALVSAEGFWTREHITTRLERSEEAVKTHIMQEATQLETSLKTHITQRSAQAEESLKDRIEVAARGAAQKEQDARLEARRERLLKSLKFDRMNERKSHVAESHPETFEWVLQDGSDRPTRVAKPSAADTDRSSENSSDDRLDSTGPESDATEGSESSGSKTETSFEGASWDSFSDWLRSTEPVYWISGKPGSGKTTLMKYLLGHAKTRSFLNLWNYGTVLISHFFWRPGTQMQQNIRGLLCSCIYQLLLQDNESLDRILLGNMDAQNKDMETDWSNQELQSTFRDVMVHYPWPIALFLDGLDEILPRDDTLRLLDLIHVLTESKELVGKVKICLGARPEPLIVKRLYACPQLRLEDLNHLDLQRYAEDNIIIPSGYHVTMFPGSTIRAYTTEHPQGAAFTCERLPSHEDIRNWLVDELVTKADGVFLWLCLTVKAVAKALNQGETITDLEQRINGLPGDLADLYADMWERINDDGRLRVRSTLYLQLVLCTDWEVPPLAMMIATNPEMADLIRNSNPAADGLAASLLETCKITKRDVEIRCAGLLECTLPSFKISHHVGLIPIPWYGDEYIDLAPYASSVAGFRFIHRTARDFLTDTVEGQKILDPNKASEPRTRLMLIEANLVAFGLFRRPPLIGFESRFTEPPLERPVMACPPESTLRYYLAAICSVLHTLPEGEDGGLRAKCENLLRLCEHQFNSGRLFGEPTVYLSGNYLTEESPARFPGLRTCYQATVRRRHEFLIEMAANNLGLWPSVLTQVRARDPDKETLSELLLHACNMEAFDFDASGCPIIPIRSMSILAVEDRLKLARFLLARGALHSWEGPRRVHQKELHGIGPTYYLDTPFKCLLSSAWALTSDEMDVDLSTARDILSFVQLLISHGVDPSREELRLVYHVVDGHLIEKPFDIHSLWDQEASPGNIDGTQFVLIHPASTIIANMLHAWGPNSPEIGSFPGAPEIIRSGAEPGRLSAIVHIKGYGGREEAWNAPPESHADHIFYLEPGQEVEKELLWVAAAAQRMLQDWPRWSAGPRLYDRKTGFPIPAEVQRGLYRAMEGRKSENAKGLMWKRVWKVLGKLGMTPLDYR